VAWTINTASYDGKLYDVSAKQAITSPQFLSGAAWSPDGANFIASGNTAAPNWVQYTTTSPWEIDTLSFATEYNTTHNTDSMFLKPDGTSIFFTLGSSTYGKTFLYQYDFSTPWDISSITFNQRIDLISSVYKSGLFFKPDGLKFYWFVNGFIKQYNLTSAWDITTLSYDTQLDVSGYSSNSICLFFHPSGTYFYITDLSQPKIYQFSTSLPWAVDTGIYSNKFGDFTSEQPLLSYFFFKPDGLKLYVAGESPNIYQYTIEDYATTYLNITASAKTTASVDRIAEKNIDLTLSSKGSFTLDTPDFSYTAISASAENTNFVNFYSPFTYGFTENITCTDLFYASNLTSGVTFATTPASVFSCVNLTMNVSNNAESKIDVAMDIVYPVSVVDSIFTVSNKIITLEASSLAVSGTVDVTFPKLTLEAHGGGAASLVCPDLTLSASGFVGIVGTTDVINPSYTLEANGSAVVGGTFDETISDVLLEAIGLTGCIGTADVTMTDITLAATGGFTVEGTADVTMPDVSLYSEGRLESRFSSEILRHSRY